MWTVRAIHSVRYHREGWMTREDTKVIFPVPTKGPTAAQWRGQAVHILLPDDRVADGRRVEVQVHHGQGARYQYNIPVPNVAGTTKAAEGI